MKKKRRILSLLLAVALMVSTWSVPVFAEMTTELTAELTVKSGDTIKVTKETIVEFVPEESGNYYFESHRKSGDPKCYLYNQAGAELRNYDDTKVAELGEREDTRDFQGKYYFTAGETYYFKLSSWGG